MPWRLNALLPCLLRPPAPPLRLQYLSRGVATLRCVDLLGPGKNSTKYLDQPIKVNGAIRSVRKQKRSSFAHISDGSTEQPLQVILNRDQVESLPLTRGTTVEIHGTWKTSPAAGQTHELAATQVKVIGEADAKFYPIQKKYQSPEYLRHIPHLRLRVPYNALLSRIRSEVIFAISTFFRSRREYGPFYQVQPPLITSSDCEGAGEVFSLEPKDLTHEDERFFKTPKYLTVSTQLHLEAYAAELGSVWALSPTFRAERSDTPRHLAEFHMLEVEVNYVRKLDDILQLTEDLIRHIVGELRSCFAGQELLAMKRPLPENRLDASDEEIQDIETDIHGRWDSLTQEAPWSRITYAEAIQHLETVADSMKFQYIPSWSAGLQLEHEKHLVEFFGKGGPIFVTDYPQMLKPFYMLASDAAEADSPSDQRPTVANFDLLFPHVVEVAGGSLREHRLGALIANMRRQDLIRTVDQREMDISRENEVYPGLELHESLGPLEWYADLRRYGTTPHGGFGLGLDRLLAYLTAVTNVRDVVGFPRYWGRADC